MTTYTPPKYIHQHALEDMRHRLRVTLARYELSDTDIDTIVLEVFPR